mmetsp:Transcript_2665/g.5880  ORF Transcript_2665/g.5880 Transcript_2665/m.5880 type:complete len:215 (-) Transcript_2665:382-1026(-)
MMMATTTFIARKEKMTTIAFTAGRLRSDLRWKDAQRSLPELKAMCGVLVVCLIWMIQFPPRRREDMLVSLVPSSLHYFRCMRVFLLFRRVRHPPHIIFDSEFKEWTAFAPRLSNYELVERYMGWHNHIFLHKQQLLRRVIHCTKLPAKLLLYQLQKLSNSGSLCARYCSPVPSPVPIAVCYPQGFPLDSFLCIFPLPPQLFPLCACLRFPLAIR